MTTVDEVLAHEPNRYIRQMRKVFDGFTPIQKQAVADAALRHARACRSLNVEPSRNVITETIEMIRSGHIKP